MSLSRSKIIVRNTRPEDFSGIAELSREVYAESPPWSEALLSSHLRVFPEGQFVAIEVDPSTRAQALARGSRSGFHPTGVLEGATGLPLGLHSGRVVGMAASLIVLWDDYDMNMDWLSFTHSGTFTNHDPAHGRTLYGAEIMVNPTMQRRGIGKKLYQARRELVQRLGLLRIRAGARLRGYHRFAHRMTAEDYVMRVVQGKISDPTLSFQLREGFAVIGVVANYLHQDPESRGFAALIEWLNPNVATPDDFRARNPKFLRPEASNLSC